jgi:hypothetical protein
MASSAVYLGLLNSWQFIAACVFLILLLPLVFYVASNRSRKKKVSPAPKRLRAARKPLPAAPAPAEDQEPDDGPSARGRDRVEPAE